MVIAIAYLLFILAILFVLLSLYNVYCILSLRSFEKQLEESTDNELAHSIKSKFSIALLILKKLAKKVSQADPKNFITQVKKIIRILKIAMIALIGIDLFIAFQLFVYGLAVYGLNQQFTSVAAIMETVTGHDKDCPCYALCTGNSEDDSKSVYELIFGPDEYNKLINLMVLTDEEYELFFGQGRYGQDLERAEDSSYLKNYTQVINESDDGRAKSEFIRDHINNDMVNAYRDLVSHNNKFRHGDGLDRTQMTQEELEKDLYALLSDYKVNGRNPNCKCQTANKWALRKVCLGEEHWHEPWKWNTIYYDDDYTGEIGGLEALGRILFVGDSRTIDMFADSDDEISGAVHDGITVYAKHGFGYDYLVESVNKHGEDKFDTLVTWMGANDAGDFSKYESYYNDLISKGKRVIVCTVGPTIDQYLESGDHPNYENAKMVQYNNSLTNWAGSNSVHVIDVYSFIGDSETIKIDQADGIHYLPRPTTEIWDYILGRLKAIGDSIGGETPKPTPGGKMGNATGQYAVQLDDGMYYWYHQDGGNGCSCVYCGNWSSAQWGGSGQKKHAFGKDGCAVYSLAIGISNLYGAEITPAVVFSDLGSPINGGSITTNSTYFTGRNIKRDAVTKALASKYGLTLSSIGYNGQGSASQVQSFIDGVLAQGGIVWGSWVDAQCKWCGNGTSHFMCIRKTDGNNYYCFTSCRGKCASSGGKAGAIETMNYPLPKSQCISGMVSGQVLYGFVNPNGGGGGTGGEGGYDLSASDQELINIFKNEVGVSEAKAYGMLACYKAATEAGLSSYETVGLLGCAMAEGTPGLVQYGFSLSGYGTSTKNSPVYVSTDAKADAWINNIVKNRGCGTAQWTDTLYRGSWSYRGRTYIEFVKNHTNDSECDYKTLWSADYDMYKYELTGGYKSLVTDMKNHNSSVESITVFSMFKYEAGWGNYKNSDNIEDYSGTFRTYLDARYANAQAVDRALRAHAN